MMPMVDDNNKLAPWIQTFAGNSFHFDNMNANTFDPVEVATVLARIPRFAGHSRWHYSVAQHCVLVSRRFPCNQSSGPNKLSGRFAKLAALLHDAPEAFIGDIASPLKHYLSSSGLDELEQRIWVWIAWENGIDPAEIHSIKHEDLAALATEQRDLMLPPPQPWNTLPPPWPERIEPWSQEYARDEWLRVYRECV